MKKLITLLLFIALISGAYFFYKIYSQNKKLPNDAGLYKGNARYIKDLGHPFSGSGLETDEGIFGLYGEYSKEIMALDDATELVIEGYKKSVERTIPEAGDFRKINWKVIDVTFYEIR